MVLWETEETMRASEEAADTASESIAGVNRYEVTFGEVSEWGAALAG